MTRIDFFISNNNHHWQMMWPVMIALKKMNFNVRLVSLCEFRRMPTPIAELNHLNISFVRLMDLRKRGFKTSTGRSIGGNKGLIRNFLRELMWLFILKNELAKIYQAKPSVVVVPNDVAFPFNKICRWFKKSDIPFFLMQEGIRFPLPNERGGSIYGSNGAHTIICWGNESVKYFDTLNLKNTKIVAGGNPRFDNELQVDYSKYVNEIRMLYDLPSNTLLYVSNPVDDQGFCSHNQKMNLFKRFLEGLSLYLNNGQIKIMVRLHPREDIGAFKNIINELGCESGIIFVQGYPIFACIQSAKLVVVLASTVGLEAALNRKPLAVVKLPGHGYIFDYVSSGCAIGIDVEQDFSNLLWDMFNSKFLEHRSRSEQYSVGHLANIGFSAQFISSYIRDALNEVYAKN